MKEFPGNHFPSLTKRDYHAFATVMLYPLGVTARSNDIECAVVQSISANIFSVQSVSASMIFYYLPQRSSQVELFMFCQWQVEAACLNGTHCGDKTSKHLI